VQNVVTCLSGSELDTTRCDCRYTDHWVHERYTDAQLHDSLLRAHYIRALISRSSMYVCIYIYIYIYINITNAFMHSFNRRLSFILLCRSAICRTNIEDARYIAPTSRVTWYIYPPLCYVNGFISLRIHKINSTDRRSLKLLYRWCSSFLVRFLRVIR